MYIIKLINLLIVRLFNDLLNVYLKNHDYHYKKN